MYLTNLLFRFLMLAALTTGWAGSMFAQEKIVKLQEKTVASISPKKDFVTIERVFPQLRFHRPVFLTGCNDDSGRVFVVEQDGIIRVFDKRSPLPGAKVFLDIRDRISRAGNEEGLIGIAFHPDYENNGQFYAHYSSRRDQEPGKVAPNVLARFMVSKDDPNAADRDSEEIILVQPQPYANHNGGMIAFGADGYLYVSLGDGGDKNDPHGHGQNVETLLGSILRIDVDRRGKGQGYGIPVDNPFLNTPKARPELWAIGLRNVWRFSFDRETGDLWAADVGQNDWEEVDIVIGGGNYGWNRIEADSLFRDETRLATANNEKPIAIYGHQWGGSITGGYVYRGKEFPGLVGSYFYGDYMTGNLWRIAKSEKGEFESELVRRTGRSIASFGEDDDGELYLLSFDGGIYRIVPTDRPEATFADWPEDLAATGLFASIPERKVSEHLIPYDVNVPFWSDHAEKSRYISLPTGKKLGYRHQGSWEVPVGTTIVKNFTIKNGGRRQMLETRLIKRTDDGWEAATYVWNQNNKSAKLQANGKQFELWNHGSVTSWHAPSSSECSACHVDAAGYVLGLTTAQLNRLGESGGNQIESWAEKEIVSLPRDFDPASAAKFCELSDTASDLETRVRVWMDVNCAMCHRPQGPGNANIDLRYETALESTKMINEKPAQGNLGLANALLVAPGEPDRSLMLERVKTLSAGRMPNIGSNQIDEEGVKLLTEWIQSMGH